MNRGLDIIGADSGGLASTLFQAGGGVLDYVKQSQAEGAATAQANTATKLAIAADGAATTAVARATVSAQLAKQDHTKVGAAKADQMAADTAVAAQDKAGGSPDVKQDDRVKAAQNAVDGAKTGVENALRSGSAAQQMTAQAQLDAANQTLDKARGGGGGGGGGGKGGGGGGGGGGGSLFLSKTLVGPVKVWHGIGALVLGVGGTIVYKKLHK